MMTDWDKEADVVVVGYGLAGAVAAIVAHDAGVVPLILEKGQYPGGCSILAGGAIKCMRDAQSGVAYLTALSGGRVPDALIRTFAHGLAENEAFVRKLAETDGARVVVQHGEFGQPSGLYPFSGRDTWYHIRIASIPGSDAFSHVQAAKKSGVYMFKLAMDNVESRGIQTWLEAPARRLELDERGAAIGVVAEREGREWRIKARRGVILATGGFEQSDWLKLQYLQGKPFYSMAPLTHTGDGVLMAQKAGAALWHMWHLHGSYGFKFSESPIAIRHSFGGYRNPERRMPWVVVDRFGRRFMNEYHPAPADTNHRPLELFDPDLPGYPRIPSYMVFDERGRTFGPIGDPIGFEPYTYQWSRDNSREVERGWILKAGSLRELADLIRDLPENEGLMEPATLESTIAEWNGLVAEGVDPLRRPKGTMTPIESPPYYAAPVWPIISNTQGGPVHDENQRVIDAFGQPIPRLYAVGELGSFFGHLYELGGNLGECFVSGRIAGAHAAAQEPRA